MRINLQSSPRYYYLGKLANPNRPRNLKIKQKPENLFYLITFITFKINANFNKCDRTCLQTFMEFFDRYSGFNF